VTLRALLKPFYSTAESLLTSASALSCRNRVIPVRTIRLRLRSGR